MKTEILILPIVFTRVKYLQTLIKLCGTNVIFVFLLFRFYHTLKIIPNFAISHRLSAKL